MVEKAEEETPTPQQWRTRALVANKLTEEVKTCGTGGAKKHWTRGVAERGTRPDEKREHDVETKGRVRSGLKKNLKLSLRGVLRYKLNIGRIGCTSREPDRFGTIG